MYLTTDEYMSRSRLPRNVLERAAVADSSVDWVGEQLSITSAYIDSRLRKRYATPLQSPVPKVVIGWLVAMVDRVAALRVGYNPSNTDAEEYKALADAAVEDLEDAAKSIDGLYDIPLDLTTSGLQPSVRGYTEAGALEGAYARRERADRNNGRGRRYP